MYTPTLTTQSFPATTSDWSMNASLATTDDEPLPARIEVFELVSYTVLMIAAFVANLVAITTILRTKSLRQNTHNLLILNLNIIDLGITLLSMTFSVGSFFDHGETLRNNYALCRFNGFFAMTFTVGSFTTAFCIAIDRYLTVVWSTRFPPTKRRVVILLTYSWVVSFMFAIFPTAEILSRFVYTEATHHCSPAWDVCAYYIIWFVHIYGLTVPVMTACYAFVFLTIRKKERRLRAYDIGAKKGNTSSAVTISKSVENKSSDQISDSMNDSEMIVGKTFRHIDPERFIKEMPSNVSSSGVSSHSDNQHSVSVHNEIEVKKRASTDLCLSERDPEIARRKSTLPRSASLKEISTGVEDNRVSRDKRKRWSFRKDLKMKFFIGDSSGEGAESDGGRNPPSQTDEIAKLKRKKERKRMLKLKNLSVDKQVALTGVLLILTTVICWTPYNIIHSCFLNINLSHPTEALTMWIGYLNALLDPLIYTFMNRRTRAARTEQSRNFRKNVAGMCDRFAERFSRLRTLCSECVTSIRARIENVFNRSDPGTTATTES